MIEKKLCLGGGGGWGAELVVGPGSRDQGIGFDRSIINFLKF